ncbi:unnamed protein product [Cylicostephanus goldi]|uniref:Uncharacterized protein n=1 Tax=Cylicostephanus goldi TaxID=71465 RepID=A0A3P7Q3T7_CYLGO|nr:unnamed protein product [Cylicostephanus goldi]
MDESTSTEDLADFLVDVMLVDGRTDANANYKREVQDRSTTTSPSLDIPKQEIVVKQMQDQATSTSLSPSNSPQPPTVVLEDAPETDVSLPDFNQ